MLIVLIVLMVEMKMDLGKMTLQKKKSEIKIAFYFSNHSSLSCCPFIFILCG